MIYFRDIDENNFEDCYSLKVSKDQKEHIASNSYSLIEAYAHRNSKERYFTHAIYQEEKMVGFMMYHYSPFIEGDPDFDEPIFYISRMMIDEKYQRNGFGKLALEKAVDLMKSYNDDLVDAIVLSCNDQNKVAYKLYQKFGFKHEGEVDDDGDHIMRLWL